MDSTEVSSSPMTNAGAVSVIGPLPKNNEERTVRSALESVLHKGMRANLYSHAIHSNKAIKEISISGLQRTTLAALKVAFQALSCMHHPNIVSSEPPIECDGCLYIQMDRYFTSLETMMRAYRDKKLKFSRSQILEILNQISSALVYLHSTRKDGANGAFMSAMIHGRLNPANILVSESGKRFALSDARIHNDAQGTDNIGYAAPELLINANLTPAADMWSLGVIIYELAAESRSGFMGGHTLKNIDAEGWKPDLSAIGDKLVANIIRRLLVPNPILRISSSDLSSILRNSQSIADLEDYFRLDVYETETTKPPSETSISRDIVEETLLPKDNDGLTALMHAARTGNIAAINRLIDAGNGVRAQDAAGLTALMHATLTKQYGAIRILAALEHGVYDCSDQTALMHAAQMNDPRAIHLIAQYEAGMKTQKVSFLADISVQSRTALMGAAAQGFTQAVDALIQYESQHRDELQRTALMYAASQNHLRAVQLLAPREGGLQDHLAQTALIMAAQNGNVEVVPFLLCEVGIKNSMGYSALMIAADKGYFEIAKHLVEHEKGMRSLTQSTALISAAYNNHYEIVQLLIPHESRMQNRHGLTAMMEAAKHGHIDVVKALVDHEKGIRDNRGRTALIIASKFGHPEIADFLSQYPEEHCTLL